MQGRLKMFKHAAIALGFSLAVFSTSTQAMPIAPLADAPAEAILVSGGCGPYAWRGPWGHCRDTPYYGRVPGGGWKEPGGVYYSAYGCAPGYWRGPWGHCRDTPYHGRDPNGGWQ